MAGLTDRSTAPGSDGRPRCPWAVRAAELERYHDDEWGRPVHGDAALLERIVLEGFQAGLSWQVILRKRPAFREAFGFFDPSVVAALSDTDLDAIAADPGIVRNRRKIEAARVNARATVRLLDAQGPGALDRLVWTHASSTPSRPTRIDEIPARTSQSTALADELRGYGFVFVGPVTMYALMQACGLVDDHLAGCSATRDPATNRPASA